MSVAAADLRGGAISRQEKWLLGLLCLLALVAFRDIIAWNFSSHSRPNPVGWFYNLSDTSPQFHYLLAIGLLVYSRERVARAYCGSGAPWSALLYLVPGTLMYAWGHYVSSVSVVYMSFLLLGFGVARFISGKRLTKEILIPVLVLVLALPLPAVLNNAIVFPFQLWTAEHVAWLLNLLGFPAALEGNEVILAHHSYSVAESCTALGFVKWLMVFALAFAYMFPCSRLHSFLVVLAAPLIAYAVNLLRALALVLNPKLDILSLHLVQGIVFFMIGFVLLYAVDGSLRRVLASGAGVNGKVDAGAASGGNFSDKKNSLLIMLVWFSVISLGSIVLPRWTGMPESSAREIRVAERIGEHGTLKEIPEPRRFLGSVRFTALLYRVYRKEQDRISLFVGYDDRSKRERSFLSPKNAYPGRVGLVEKRYPVYIETIDKSVEAVLIGNQFGGVLSYHWYVGVGSVTEEVLRALLALDQSPWRRPDGGFVVRVATSIASTAQGVEEADQKLREFLVRLAETGAAESGKRQLPGIMLE